MRRGTAFIAGPPTGSPSPGLVTTPTPSPRSRSSPGSSRHEARAVRWAPSVTSGSSPASLTTTASVQAPPSPNSHRSTWNSTRRSSPFFGSFMSTRTCGSPVASARAAALAAAAAQVPVVQPVLSLSPLTFSMLGGMEGSRSLRGGIYLLLGGLQPWHQPCLRLAEHVRELRAVEVGARAAGPEARADEDECLAGKTRLPDAVGEVFEAALDHLLVGPARPVDDGAGGLRDVTAFDEVALQGARFGGGEEDSHGRPVVRETPDTFAFWHRGAARTAGQDHRLGDLWYGQLATDGGGRSAQGGHPGDYLPVETYLLTLLDLLHHRPVEARVARVGARHPQILPHPPLVELAHAFEGDSGRLDDLRFGTGVFEDVLVDEAPSPDHHVGLADEPRTSNRQEIRGPRPRPYEPHL